MQLHSTLVKLIDEHSLETVTDELVGILGDMDSNDELSSREEAVILAVEEHLQEAQEEIAELEEE